MALASGDRIGSYVIGGQLGAGGMGEVYRARDRRLDRDVAIKIISPSFTAELAALLASAISVRRLTRLDPMAMLRDE